MGLRSYQYAIDLPADTMQTQRTMETQAAVRADSGATASPSKKRIFRYAAK
jgi:hypothetical protein